TSRNETPLKRQRPLAAIVLAAGKGTRMKSALPKVLHPLAGLPMVHHVLAAVGAAGADRRIVVLAPDMTEVAKAVAPVEVAIQDAPLGTGHAVLAARNLLKGFDGDVAVVFGDTPLIQPSDFALVREAMGRDAAIGVLGFRPTDPARFGRLVMGRDGQLERIVEFKDATAE